MKLTVAAVLAVAWSLAAGAQGGEMARSANEADDALVGISYFAGWWTEEPNKYAPQGEDWRPEWPERRALLGEFNTQQTMDKEIQAAAGHAVDFFLILWYKAEEDRPEEVMLNRGVRFFMNSPHADMMKFAVEYTNHPPFGITTEERWEEMCHQWVEFMKHPSYLRVDGRPVFKVHSLHHILQFCGGDMVKVAARVERLRAVAREAGLGELCIGAGVGPGGVPGAEATAPFDWLGTYMAVPEKDYRKQPYPYEDVAALAFEGAERYAEHGPKPYVPYLPAGWDPRPWGDPRPSFHLPNREQWRATLERMKAAVARDNLGLPKRNGETVGAFTIYAWNEFGEGGAVAPTQGDQYMKLEEIQEVFGR